MTAHSDKEGARGNVKGGFGYHPLGAWLDNTGEALAAVLPPGNAGSNTAADHLVVLDRALTQLPDRWRSKPILVRADGAGYSHALINAISAGAGVLGRLPGHRRRPSGDQVRYEVGLGQCQQRRRGPA